jgi:hypothetical protein
MFSRPKEIVSVFHAIATPGDINFYFRQCVPVLPRILRFWHKCEVPIGSRNVCCLG